MNHGWEKKRLGNVCSAKGRIVRANSRFSKEDTITYIDISSIDISSNKIIEADEYRFGEAPSRAQQVIQENDILFSLVRPNLKNIARVEDDKNNLVASSGFCVLRSELMDSGFIYYLVTSDWFTHQVLRKCYGAAYPAIRENDLRGLIVPIPSKEQQRTIVAELDALNEAMEVKRKQLKALDALAQALFYDTFGDPIANPKGWEIKALGEIATIQTGATPSRKKQNNFAGNIPWVKTTEVHNCDIFSTEEHISETALNESNCKIFPIDTVLIAMYGQGKTRGQVARLKIAASTNQACAAILPNSGLNQTFLFRLLRCSYEDLRGKAIGGNQKNLNLLLIKKYPVPLPPLPLQKQFAAQVEEIEREKENVEATIARLQTLLDSRMDYWFND